MSKEALPILTKGTKFFNGCHHPGGSIIYWAYVKQMNNQSIHLTHELISQEEGYISTEIPQQRVLARSEIQTCDLPTQIFFDLHKVCPFCDFQKLKGSVEVQFWNNNRTPGMKEYGMAGAEAVFLLLTQPSGFESRYSRMFSKWIFQHSSERNMLQRNVDNTDP